MLKTALLLAAVAAGVSALWRTALWPPSPRIVTQATASEVAAKAAVAAAWDAWNQIDCDELDMPTSYPSSCTDEAGNVNKAARVASLRRAPNGKWVVTVYVTVGNVDEGYREVVDPATWQTTGTLVP